MKAKCLYPAAALAAAFLSFSVSAESELSLEQRVAHLEQLNQTRNKVQADFAMQLSQLKQEVRQLRGQLEEHAFKLSQIQERQRDLYRELDRRLSQTPAVVNNPVTTASNTDAKATKPQATLSDARSEFEAAFALVRNRQYDKAIQAFEAFLTQYPQGEFSDNAKFWIGQVYYAQGNNEAALKAFNELLTQYPDSSKAASAKLKLADIYFKQQQWDKARQLYREVADSASGAQQQLARKGLDKLREAGH